MARKRRKARKNARRGRRIKRRVKRINVGRRRRRRNPTATQKIYGPMGAPFASGPSGETKPKRKRRRGKARKLTTKQRRNRRLRRKLLASATRLRASARKAPRGSYRRSSLTTQAHRASTLRRALVRGRPMKGTAVYKAMHVKANPGLAGLVNTAKVLLPHVGIGAGALVGAAWAGKKVSAMVVKDAAGATRAAFKDAAGADKAIVKYMPAIGTAGVAVAGYLIADKFAPKFKGAVVIGGLLGAVVQTIIAASADAKEGSVMARVRQALLGPVAAVVSTSPTAPATTAPPVAGLGSGIFRQVGDYTMVGDAYGTGRPRGSADNATQWAMNGYQADRPRLSADNRSQWSVNGLDDSTNFAPGEGGVLSGTGIFR